MNPVPLLLGAAGIVGLLVFAGPKTPQPSGPPVIPPVVPPVIPPVVPPNVDTLRARLATLLTQAAANPATVDVAAMDALATELDAAGLPLEAAQVRAAALQVRLARGEAPPIAAPGTPGGVFPGTPIGPQPTMDPTLANQMNVILTSFNANPDIVEDLANRIAMRYPGFFQPEIQRLRAHAQVLRNMRA